MICMRKTSKTAAFATFSVFQFSGHYEVPMTNPNLLQSTVLWIDESKYCFSLFDFQYAFLDLTETKQQIWKTLNYLFIRLICHLLSLNQGMLKKSKAKNFFLFNRISIKCMQYGCQMFNIHHSYLPNHCFLLSESSYESHMCGNGDSGLY